VRRRATRFAVAWAVVAVVSLGLVPLLSLAARGRLGHGPGTLDHAVRAWMYAHRAAPLDTLAAALTWLGSAAVMSAIALVAGAWLWRRCGRAAGAIVASPAVAEALHQTAKLIAGRLRPPGGGDKDTFAFPSGHAATSAAVFLTLAFVLGRERMVSRRLAGTIAVLGTLLVGVSRVYRDVHWATDVLGGWGVGLAVAAVAAGLYDWLRGERGEFGRDLRDSPREM